MIYIHFLIHKYIFKSLAISFALLAKTGNIAVAVAAVADIAAEILGLEEGVEM